MLPFQVPYKLGVVEFLWQLGVLEDRELQGRSVGTLFPLYTVAHHFVITKGGWAHLEKFLSKFKMATSIAWFIDPEGFYKMLRDRIKVRAYNHIFYYPEDVVRNELSL